MNGKQWEKQNEEHLAAIAGDDELGNDEYVDVLEDLIDRARTMVEAKREEMEK